MSNIKVCEDGFVWLIVNNKAEEIYRSDLFTLFALYDDETESELDSMEDLNRTLEKGYDIGIEVGFIKDDGNE